jgi:hypothetical protein
VWARWETAVWAVFHGVHALFACASFERGRTDLTERRVPTPLVIEHFDVVEQLHLGFAAAGVSERWKGLHRLKPSEIARHYSVGTPA